MHPSHKHFTPMQKLLHWSMAVLILAMLFIGIAMVTTVSRAHETLIDLHRPLGIALLLLVIIRFGTRLRHGSPRLPESMPAAQRTIARASHVVLYGLMAAMPATSASVRSCAARSLRTVAPTCAATWGSFRTVLAVLLIRKILDLE